VVAGLVLHVMFFAGAFALFHEDLEAWQETSEEQGPASGPASTLLPLQTVVDRALGARGVKPAQLSLALSAEHPFVDLAWPAGGPEWAEARIDRRSGREVAPSSHVARLLFWLHFLYHPAAPWGMQVAGFFGVALLLALVTGVLIHLKDIVRQFHQFRPGRAVRVLWSDLHKVLGVMGLPFQVMFAFTGALLCLAALLLGAFTGPIFAGDQTAAGAAVYGPEPEVKASGRPGPAPDLDAAVARAQTLFPGLVPTYLMVADRNDQDATVKLWGKHRGTLFALGQLTLRARDGALLGESFTGRTATPGAGVLRWVTGLHYALYGGLATKILYALLALGTCLTILSGNWIWLVRRQARAAQRGNQVLARLTLGFGGGVVPATAALFLANRLAPAGARPGSESVAFFGVWALTTAVCLLRPESRAAWVWLLRLSAGGFALVPVASLFTGAHLLNLGTHGRAEVLGVEGGLLVLAGALLASAAVLGQRGAWATSATG
jgi:uncharacterized iron-regulated membrane protein